MKDKIELRAVDQIRLRGGSVTQTCGLKTPRRTQHTPQRHWPEVLLSPSLAPRVRRHSWGEAQLGRTSRKGTGGGAYCAESQRGGACATEEVYGGRCRRSTVLGRSEGRNSRVDRSWRCKCHYYSHHFLITASDQGTGARSLLKFLAITRTVTAQEAQLRTRLRTFGASSIGVPVPARRHPPRWTC